MSQATNPRPVCVVSADWHAQERAWQRHRDLSGDALFGISQVFDLCVTGGLPLVGAGDLFDTARPRSDTSFTTPAGCITRGWTSAGCRATTTAPGRPRWPR
jgi:hypothetical protein